MSRDILAPPIMRMEPNRNYRINLIHDDFAEQQKAAQQTGRPVYQETEIYGEDYNETEDEPDDECVNIEELPNFMFKLTIHVAPSFYGGLIGQKGMTRRRIESETNTELTVPPRSNNTNSLVIVKGKTRSSVVAAKHKIKLLLDSLRKRMSATHFYGVPLNFGQVQENFKIFREQILTAELPGIEETLFQSDCCLHLTFGACVLMDEMERNKATALLQTCREFLSDLPTPFKVNVQGLDIMNDDPSAVRVLYAGINSPNLQIFANRCFERFKSSGLAKDESRDHVKLHMTILNNRYKERDSTDNKIMNTFDAREILKRWGNFDFGSIECTECVLCIISSSKQEKNQFYKITSSLKF